MFLVIDKILKASLKNVCVFIPLGPTNRMGYQVFSQNSVDRLIKYFGHIMILAGSKDSEVQSFIDLSNVTVIKLPLSMNPIDIHGNEYCSLEALESQLIEFTKLVSSTSFRFVLQIHCNQYFTISNLIKLTNYLFFLRLFNLPYGWLGRVYQCFNLKTQAVKSLPYIINLNHKNKSNFEIDGLKYKGQKISAKYYNSKFYLFNQNFMPNVVDILFEYSYEDLKTRYQYYFSRIHNYESFEDFYDGWFNKFSQFKYNKIGKFQKDMQKISNVYSENAIAFDFVKNYLKN